MLSAAIAGDEHAVEVARTALRQLACAALSAMGSFEVASAGSLRR